VRIVDFSTHLPGPMASHLLCELGATVVKVENPRGGDGNRQDIGIAEGLGLAHLVVNAGVRSLALDRRSPHWEEVVAACARWADAVVVGARPVDAMARGLDFGALRAANPDIVYCSISGFGDDGPWAGRRAGGPAIDAYAGLMDVDHDHERPRARAGWRSSSPTLAGMFAAMGILAALHRRDHSVEGAQYVSVSLWDAAMWWNWRELTMQANTGTAFAEPGNIGSRYAMYATSDARALMLAAVDRPGWERFCDTVGMAASSRGRGDWGRGFEAGRGPAFDDEREEIVARIASRTLDDWTALFVAAEVPFAPVLSVSEALASEHQQANSVMRPTRADGQAWSIPAVPIRLDGAPAAELPGAPAVGADTDDVLRELGLSHLVGGLEQHGR
jgi:crotonobetainyl-CoA:carnitine CoA-transferase CaiB-like acyl-CoA transferase